MIALRTRSSAHNCVTVRSSAALLLMIATLFAQTAFQSSLAQDLPSAADLMPEQTQGYIRIVDLPRLLGRWNQTQYGRLLEVPGLQEFWEEQQQEIQGRLMEAGWKLNITPDDLNDVAAGQVAVGWLAMPKELRKPYAVALVADIAGREVETEDLLEKVSVELLAANATKETLKIGEATATKYILPRRPGELIKDESYYAILDGQLYASDNQSVLVGLLKARQNPEAVAPLSKSADYVSIQKEIDSTVDDADLQYYVRPIGLAKVLRSISRKPNNRQTDVLQVLVNQGFDKISAVAGELRIAEEQFDLHHRAFVLAEKPLPTSVQILDFPNESDREIPVWIAESTATIASFCWNAKEAFWKAEALVDEMAAAEGTFQQVIEGIRDDPKGPGIDIRNDVLPLITNQLFALSDCVEPVTPDSRRTLIAVRLTDGDKMSEIVDRALQQDPDAEALDIDGHRIWQVVRQDDIDIGEIENPGFDDLGPGVDDSFGDDFGGDEDEFGGDFEEEEEKEEPWLSNWALTVNDDYLLFASHASVITDALARKGQSESELMSNPDYRRVQQVISRLTDDRKTAGWNVSLTQRAFQMQYELFRQDKLPQSRSMLASILDRLLRPKSEAKQQQQRLSGDKLPPFDTIKEFLMPSGAVFETVSNGWAIESFVLAK